VPGDLRELVKAMRGVGATVIKVAVTPTRLSETLMLREIAREGDAVVIGMGDAGVPTRLLACRFGSRWTYGGTGVAPGQLPVARMLEAFRFRSIGAQTALYGAVGRDGVQSLAPAMHNAAFAAAGLDAVCVPLCAADFEDFLTFADALGITGAGVTSPFTLDALAASVRPSGDRLARLGTVNTVRRVADGWEATNTEGNMGPRDETHELRQQNDIEGLVADAGRQFEWWTGRRAEPGVMHAAAVAAAADHEIASRGRT
jgi:3-dehydroquinate dehydratase/shikimate dehydrogenase